MAPRPFVIDTLASVTTGVPPNQVTVATAVTHDGFGTRKITSARLKLLPG